MEKPMSKTRPIPSKSLLGETVNDGQGKGIGKIEEVVKLENGTISSLVITTGKLLKKRIAIPWEMLKIDDNTQALSLDVDKEFLDRIPAYQGDQ